MLIFKVDQINLKYLKVLMFTVVTDVVTDVTMVL